MVRLKIPDINMPSRVKSQFEEVEEEQKRFRLKRRKNLYCICVAGICICDAINCVNKFSVNMATCPHANEPCSVPIEHEVT